MESTENTPRHFRVEFTITGHVQITAENMREAFLAYQALSLDDVMRSYKVSAQVFEEKRSTAQTQPLLVRDDHEANAA